MFMKRTTATLICSLAVLLAGMSTHSEAAPGHKIKCLVLGDGYVSEYAWGKYEESQLPAYHPGNTFFIRGITDYPNRFKRWLGDFQVTRIDLEQQRGPLPLSGVDILIIDDVRQVRLDPWEESIVEYVRQGGGLLVYGGYWGLGGAPKNEYNVATQPNDVSSPLATILPVTMLSAPDWTLKQEGWGPPVVDDPALGEGLDTADWHIYGLHSCEARGKVLARVADRPLVCVSAVGRGNVVVYTGDDLAWIRAGARDNVFCRQSGTLWRRLAQIVLRRDARAIPAVRGPSQTWEKTAAFAHPDQPINFLWGGYFPFTGANDLEHTGRRTW